MLALLTAVETRFKAALPNVSGPWVEKIPEDAPYPCARVTGLNAEADPHFDGSYREAATFQVSIFQLGASATAALLGQLVSALHGQTVSAGGLAFNLSLLRLGFMHDGSDPSNEEVYHGHATFRAALV